MVKIKSLFIIEILAWDTRLFVVMRTILIYNRKMNSHSCSTIGLNQLNPGESAVIFTVGLNSDTDSRMQLAGIQRLEELGFVPGERLMLMRRGLGGDPLAIRIGTSLFALRKVEASAIRVQRD